MHKMTPPIKDLLPRLTPILKNRHEKVQENCIDLVGRIADRCVGVAPFLLGQRSPACPSLNFLSLLQGSRVRVGQGVDEDLLRAAGAAEGPQEGHPQSHRQHLRLHRQSHRVRVNVHISGLYLVLCTRGQTLTLSSSQLTQRLIYDRI